MVPGVSRAIFLLSTMASWGCSEPLSHVLLSTGTWASPEQGILPQQAEDAESMMEASVAHSALKKGYLVNGCWDFLEKWEKWDMLSHLQSCSESFSIQMLVPNRGR